MGTLDNTLLSVETGLTLGTDIVEEDVRVTKDGVPVLAHDDVWETVDGRSCSVSALTYAELSELTIAVQHGGRTETMRFCPLEPVLPLVKAAGKVVNLDLKVDDSIEPVADLVRRYGLGEQAILSGCERERALLAQRSHPELRKLLNVETNLFLTLPYEEAMARTCSDALAASCIGLNVNYRLVRQELMDYAAARELAVYVWTVNEPELMEQFVRLGVHSITARNVQALVQLKERLQREMFT
jgi:glycerophosphoryl diester phosphodiesterase